MIYYLVQTNFVDLTIVFFLYIFLFTGTTLNKSQTNIFLISTFMLTLLIFADSTDYYLASLETPSALRYITSATGYTLRPGCIMMMLYILRPFTKSFRCFILIFFIVNMITAYLSIFTHSMFYFDEANQFFRGPLGILPFVLSGFYLILLLITSIKKYRMGNKFEAAVVVFIVIMAVISSAMETIFHFKFLINGVGGISLVFYYLFLHTQTYKRDALTGALNRHSFYSDSKRLSKKSMIVVSIDLNNLKTINDFEGHDAGDKAIVTTAKCILHHLSDNDILYRMGGDEFAILSRKSSEERIKLIMEKILKSIHKNGYELAWGYAVFNPEDNFEEIFKLSDERMYENKRIIKSQKI